MTTITSSNVTPAPAPLTLAQLTHLRDQKLKHITQLTKNLKRHEQQVSIHNDTIQVFTKEVQDYNAQITALAPVTAPSAK